MVSQAKSKHSIITKRQKKTEKKGRFAVTLHHLDQHSVLDALDGAQFCKAVEGGASQLEVEACAVTSELVIH